MSTITIELPGISIDGMTTNPKHTEIRVYYVLHTATGRIYFDRHGTVGEEQWSRINEQSVYYNSIKIPLDPITALMRGLATAEEIGLPAGLEGLVALAKAVAA